MPHSDIGDPEILGHFLDLFVEAHRNAPGGASVEIGTGAGGSALMFLLALGHLYESPPMLFTVDPYGDKAYPKGVFDQTEYHYGGRFYVASKMLLAPFANHAHFLMRSSEFWALASVPYWCGGQRLIGDLSFVFLDGDHSPPAVVADTAMAMRYLREGGMVVIDNIDWQADIRPALGTLGRVRDVSTRWMALQK